MDTISAICECADAACVERFELRRSDYAGIRSASERFAVLPGQAQHKLASTYSLDTDTVFCSTTGQHLQPGNVRQRGWGKALEKAGIPHAWFHETRHAYASTLIAARVPVTSVASVMGHSDATVTLKIYSHLFDRVSSHEAVREAIAVLS